MTKTVPSIEVTDETGSLLAIISRIDSFGQGVHFVTPDDLQQQVAIMNRPAGEVIPAHSHLAVPRSLRGTQEVLIVLRGAVEADIFDNHRCLVQRIKLKPGDIITLVSGGHGFTISEDSLIIEVKQGPYVPGKDKEVFDGKEQRA